jgi:hypothetical protein
MIRFLAFEGGSYAFSFIHGGFSFFYFSISPVLPDVNDRFSACVMPGGTIGPLFCMVSCPFRIRCRSPKC